MIRKKFLYSTAILTLALQVGDGSPSVAMEYPAYDKSGNAVGTLGVKRRDQDVLEFTLTSNQTGNHVSFDNPAIVLDTTSNGGSGCQTWKLDLNKQTGAASLDLSKDILQYRSSFYAPSQFPLGGYGYTRGTSIRLYFSDGNFVHSVAFPSAVLTGENANARLGSLLLEAICPEKMSKKAIKKAKQAAQDERIGSQYVAPPLSEKQRAETIKNAKKQKKAMKNSRKKRR